MIIRYDERLAKYTEIMNNINYKNWMLIVGFKTDLDGNVLYYYLKAEFKDETGKYWSTRKWILSPHMTVSEVVQTAFLMIKTAEEHELRESFKYKGQAIFGPHFNVEQLCNMASLGERALDVRTN